MLSFVRCHIHKDTTKIGRYLFSHTVKCVHFGKSVDADLLLLKSHFNYLAFGCFLRSSKALLTVSIFMVFIVGTIFLLYSVPHYSKEKQDDSKGTHVVVNVLLLPLDLCIVPHKKDSGYIASIHHTS